MIDFARFFFLCLPWQEPWQTYQGQTTCESKDLDAGQCVGNNKCFNCDFTQFVWPIHGKGFPHGRLFCSGNQGTTCTMVDDTEKLIFRNYNDYLECEGSGTCVDWNVENAGAACCSAQDGGQTCSSSKISLEPDSECINDMCCDGYEVCSDSTLNGLNTLSCRGPDACSDLKATLSKDLYCNDASKVMTTQVKTGGTCSDSKFTVKRSDDDKHAVACFGPNVCSKSDFSFAKKSKISFKCDSAAGTGGSPPACAESKVTLKGDSCLYLQCAQPTDCTDLSVIKETSDDCFVAAAFDIPGCESTNVTDPCGPIDPPEPCCWDDEGCANCCPAKSTTTTKKPKPYHEYTPHGDWRRNRRENRRNRRQHRRTERQG